MSLACEYGRLRLSWLVKWPILGAYPDAQTSYQARLLTAGSDHRPKRQDTDRQPCRTREG
jgi:hypothetical protein